MGLWEDITREFSNVFNGNLARDVSNFNARIRKEFERGDIGKAAASQVTMAEKGAKGSVQIFTEAARGNSSGVKEAAGYIAGSATTAGLGPTSYLFSTDSGQKFLENKYVDKYSGGFSGDYAGTIRAGNELMRTGSTSRENIDDSLRFAGKAGLIGSAVVGYNAYQSAASVGGSALPGYGQSLAAGAGYAKDGALVYGAGKSLARGDVGGAINQIGQISGDYGIPEVPKAPSWVPDLGDIFKDFIGAGGSKAPMISNPWVYDGGVDSGPPRTASSIQSMAPLLAIGAIGVAFLIYKLGKK